MNLPVTIYCDESGFTGNNLMNPDQTIFSYASVQVEKCEADEFVKYIVKKYNIQGGELKGANLIKYDKGKRAISEILSRFDGRMKVIVSVKKFALAGKFFEYIFEPLIQRNNVLFYNLNFHLFISNILYVELLVRNRSAEKIFEDFEKVIRIEGSDELSSLFSPKSNYGKSPVLDHIKEFVDLNRIAIKRELQNYPGSGMRKWVLDLTSGSLFSLLANWGQDYEKLIAICDKSIPLFAHQSMFNVMINRKDRKFLQFRNKETSITFNLNEPLKFADSKNACGIQIADCIAAASTCIMNSTSKDDYILEWKKYISPSLTDECVFPDLDYIDLKQHSVQKNAVVLCELVRRSRSRVDLLEGMSEYVSWVSEQLILNPIPLKNDN